MNNRYFLSSTLCTFAVGMALQFGTASCKSSSSEIESGKSSTKVSTEKVADTSKSPPKPAALQESKSWAADLDRVDKQIVARRKRATSEKSWLDWERVSLLESERARLTGDYNSYVRAEEALTEAFAVAPKGTGPFSTRAFLNMRLHRLSRVEADLQAMESAAVLTAKDRNSIIGYRADVAYYSGDLKTAEKLYTQVAKAEPAVRNVAALARLHWKMGDFKGAEAFLAQATELSKKGRKSDRAWLNLMRGLMKLDQNKLDEALVHYNAGLAIQPGYWLLEEHVAEVLLLKGETDLALEKYQDLVERTNSPEFMDQIASIWRDRGNTSEFERWRDRARAIHLEHLKLVPEAAVGHALDHFLELEDDRKKALELAIQNHSIRSGGESKEKLISAHLLNKNYSLAKETAMQMEKSGWKTADALALASLAYEMSGDKEKAAIAKAAANELAEDADSRVEWLREAIGS